MDTGLIREEERLDDLERSGLKIIQNPSKFCFGMDAVLLSGFAGIRKGERVIDLGTGTGIIPILLSAKTQGEHFTGLEIQDYMADMADRSVRLNGLEERISILHGDIRNIRELFPLGSFDAVTCNPPYMNDMHGIKNPDEALAIARHELKCTLSDIVNAAAYLLKNGGRFYMVHRPHRLIDIISESRSRKLEPKTVQFVHPFKDKPANMVLIEAVKGAGVWLKVKPPVAVYEEAGRYSREIYDIYGY